MIWSHGKHRNHKFSFGLRFSRNGDPFSYCQNIYSEMCHNTYQPRIVRGIRRWMGFGLLTGRTKNPNLSRRGGAKDSSIQLLYSRWCVENKQCTLCVYVFKTQLLFVLSVHCMSLFLPYLSTWRVEATRILIRSHQVNYNQIFISNSYDNTWRGAARNILVHTAIGKIECGQNNTIIPRFL